MNLSENNIKTLTVASLAILIAVLSTVIITFIHPIIGGAIAAISLFAVLTLAVNVQKSILEKRLKLDEVTGFELRKYIPLNIVPDEGKAIYAIYAHFADLDEIASRFGGKLEQQVLKVLAEIVRQNLVSDNTTIYRYSEHAAILLVETDKSVKDLIVSLGIKTREIYQTPIPIPGLHFPINLNIHLGIAKGEDAEDISKLIEYARFAIKPSFSSSEPSIRLFSKESFEHEENEIARRMKVVEVIEENQIESVFQPILDCRKGEIDGYEALSRTTHPAFKHIGQLLNDAEKINQYTNLEIALTYNAIDAYRRNLKDHPSHPRLFLNMAPEAIKHGIYAEDIRIGIFDNIRFVIEVVERGEILPELIRKLRDTVTHIKAAIALDDFGTGYSNHLALLNTKPDIIKVSRELIMDIDKDVDKQHVYMNIVVFARNLNTEVLAEGVETQEEFEVLQRLGMDYCQGFFVGKPSAVLTEPSAISVDLCKSFHELA